MDEVELNILPCSTSPLSSLITPLPANIFTSKFAPNVANNISENHSFVLLPHFQLFEQHISAITRSL